MAGFAPEVLALLQSMGLYAPMGIGEKFYVNGGADGVTAGIDAAGRGSKDRPFLTIAYALTQCVGGRNDYVYCWNTRNQDTAPIEIDFGLSHVHIIGLAMPGGAPLELEPADDNPMFHLNPSLGGSLPGIEIAGFNLGGGATHGCIEVEGMCNMLWIHDCTFGHLWVPAAQDGIWVVGLSNSQSVLIERNWFYGEKITQFGISAPAATAHLAQGTIRDNYFIIVPTGAISLPGDCDQMVIEHNKIACGADVAGNAIDLGAFTHGCLVANNEAAHGSTALMTAAPYRDTAPDADDNHWMSNQAQDQFVLPNEVPS